MNQAVRLTVNRSIPGLSPKAEYSLDKVLPNTRDCPFIIDMLGEDSPPLDSIPVVFHQWSHDTNRDWHGDEGQITVPLSEFKKGDNDEIAAIFVHELCHVALQEDIRPYENYFESPEEQQAIVWSILYLQYLGKEEEWIETWLERTYPRMPGHIRRTLHDHPEAFTRDVYDPAFGTWEDDPDSGAQEED